MKTEDILLFALLYASLFLHSAWMVRHHVEKREEWMAERESLKKQIRLLKLGIDPDKK